MTYKIEVLIVPVSDADRALVFYSEQAGFALDVDYQPGADFRVVQLTPPGSGCSIQLKTPRQSELASTVFHVRPSFGASVVADRSLRWRPDTSFNRSPRT
jgi:hypothetical protein